MSQRSGRRRRVPEREPGPPRFDATIHAGRGTKDLRPLDDIQLDRMPDRRGRIRALLTAEECATLLDLGFEVRLHRHHPVKPLDPGLIATDESVQGWLDEIRAAFDAAGPPDSSEQGPPDVYRTPAQIESIISFVGTWLQPLCTRVELANPSIQGRKMQAVRLAAGGGSGRRGVLIVGGLHARELMNPDAIVELLRDLILAYIRKEGITYGGRSWSALEIKTMVRTLDIWMIPCANPDGRQRVLNGDSLWRKNLRDNPGTSCEGVDVNRNFDIAWGITTTFTSCDPCAPSQTYCGPAPFSEPESRNIRDFCDSHQIDVYVDVHSFEELVLYPWGHAVTQTISPIQNFKRLKTGTCRPLDPPTYREYLRPADLLRYQTVSQRIVDSVHLVRGRNYTPEPIHSVYASGATGTSSDYVYSRHIRDPSLHKTYGFALETGPNTGNVNEDFHPSDETKLALIKQDAKAAILTLIEQSICAIDFIGTTVSDQPTVVDAIRAFRDKKLATTKAGLEWIELVDRVQAGLLATIVSDEALTEEAAGLFERVSALVTKRSTKLRAGDVERARRFLAAVAKRVESPDLKRDISRVSDRLGKSEGQTATQIVSTMMRERPGARRRS